MSGSIRHILCGVDGSAEACHAAEKAAELALALGARLSFVAVTSDVAPDADLATYRYAEGIGAEPVPLLSQAAETCLSVAMTTASQKGYRGATRIVRSGEVSSTLISVAAEIGADTIAVGRHRHSGLRRAVFGSVSQGIADRTSLTIISLSG
jgi:nucleotide-binding universal stress UspA family protein